MMGIFMRRLNVTVMSSMSLAIMLLPKCKTETPRIGWHEFQVRRGDM